MSENKYEQMEKDVKDLLNQVMIKLEDVKKFEASYDDDGYPDNDNEQLVKEIWTPTDKYIPNPKFNKELDSQVFLSCVKGWVERALEEGREGLQKNENKYYTSTCYG